MREEGKKGFEVGKVGGRKADRKKGRKKRSRRWKGGRQEKEQIERRTQVEGENERLDGRMNGRTKVLKKEGKTE